MNEHVDELIFIFYKKNCKKMRNFKSIGTQQALLRFEKFFRRWKAQILSNNLVQVSFPEA